MSDRASSEAQMRPLRRPALAVLGGCLLLVVLYLGWRASGLDSDQGAEGMPAPESEVASPTAEPTSTTLEPLRGPTLLANAGERGDSRDPTPGQPIATQPHLRVRVVAADKPVEGVSIGVWSTVEEVAETELATGQSDEHGMIDFGPAPDAYPILVVTLGQGAWQPAAVRIEEPPQEVVHIELHGGEGIEVEVLAAGGDPLPNARVLLLPMGFEGGVDARPVGASGAVSIRDTRDLVTGATGAVYFEGLVPERVYRAHVPGWGIPPGYGVHDSAAPGAGSRIVLRLLPARYVWARAIDAETGTPVDTAQWTPDYKSVPGDAPPREWSQGGTLGSLRAVLLSGGDDLRSGDLWREIVLTRADAKGVSIGPHIVTGSGYRATTVNILAREWGTLIKPHLVVLERDQDSSTGALSIVLRNPRGRAQATIEVRVDRSTVYRSLVRTDQMGEPCGLLLAAGEYEVKIGGTLIETATVSPGQATEVIVDLALLPAIRVLLEQASPYNGTCYLAMQTEHGASGLWYLLKPDVQMRESTSPWFYAPEGVIRVYAKSDDGHEFEQGSVRAIAGHGEEIRLRRR